MKKKVIIDTDPGIDDALALIFALQHPDIEILGITSVAGNKGLDSTTNNVTRILNYFNADISVYKGETDSYSSSINDALEVKLDYEKETIHGQNGLGSARLEKSDSLISEKSAVDFILETINQYPNEVDILTLGPLTNIAYCIDKDEETMKKVKSIHSMGGGIKRGNRTPVAEFNYWFDAHAVNKVFSLGTEIPVHMVGLDVTHQAALDMNELTFMKLINPDLGELVNKMLADYIRSYWEDQRILGAVIHDLTVIIGYMYPEIYSEVYHGHMACVTDSELALGQTIADLQGRFVKAKNAYIPMHLNLEMYKEKFIEVVFGKKALNEYIAYIKK